jgi:hypothetical protein
MEDLSLRDEVEMRINPENFTMDYSDILDIVNLFDVDEESVTQIYSELVAEKQSEIRSTIKDIVDEFREKDNYYPSFEEFKKVFSEYEDSYFIDNNIIRDMYKNEINDRNQIITI